MGHVVESLARFVSTCVRLQSPLLRSGNHFTVLISPKSTCVRFGLAALLDREVTVTQTATSSNPDVVGMEGRAPDDIAPCSSRSLFAYL